MIAIYMEEITQLLLSSFEHMTYIEIDRMFIRVNQNSPYTKKHKV